jgi:hypothetical protein
MIDRSVDPVSPFVYQQTYEGWLDDHFGIDSCVMSVPEKIAMANILDIDDDEKSDYLLTNDSYPHYEKIRSLHHTCNLDNNEDENID